MAKILHISADLHFRKTECLRRELMLTALDLNVAAEESHFNLQIKGI